MAGNFFEVTSAVGAVLSGIPPNAPLMNMEVAPNQDLLVGDVNVLPTPDVTSGLASASLPFALHQTDVFDELLAQIDDAELIFPLADFDPLSPEELARLFDDAQGGIRPPSLIRQVQVPTIEPVDPDHKSHEGLRRRDLIFFLEHLDEMIPDLDEIENDENMPPLFGAFPGMMHFKPPPRESLILLLGALCALGMWLWGVSDVFIFQFLVAMWAGVLVNLGLFNAPSELLVRTYPRVVFVSRFIPIPLIFLGVVVFFIFNPFYWITLMFNLGCSIHVSLTEVVWGKDILSPFKLMWSLLSPGILWTMFALFGDMRANTVMSGIPKVSSGNYVMAGICGPLVEELIKHYIPFGFLLPYAEFTMYVTLGVSGHNRLAPLFMHIVAQFLPLPLAVLLHSWWNMGVMGSPLDDFHPYATMLHDFLWSPIPMSIVGVLGSFSPPGLEAGWYEDAPASTGSTFDLLVIARKVSEREKERRVEAPSDPVWERLRFKGKSSNPGLSRGRISPAAPPPSRGGMPHNSRVIPVHRYSLANVFPREDEPRGCLWVDPPRVMDLNRSRRVEHLPRRSFGGTGETGDSLFSRGLGPRLKTGVHVARTLLTRRERRKLIEERRTENLSRAHTSLLQNLLADKASVGSFIAMVRSIDEDIQSEGAVEELQKLREKVAPLFFNLGGGPSATSPLHSLFQAVKTQIETYLGVPFPEFTYQVFLALLTLLTADTPIKGSLACETLGILVRDSSLAPDLKTKITVVLDLGGAGLLLGAFAPNPFRGEEVIPEGFAEWSDLYSQLTNSPLAVKVVALLATLVPLFSKMESSVLGSTFFDLIVTWAGTLQTFVGTPLAAMISFVAFMSERYAKFSETGKFSDLFGQSPSIEWLDKAKDLEVRIDAAKKNPANAKPRTLIEEGRSLVRKSTKLKEPLVTSKARNLDEVLDTFEGSLSGVRKAPVGFIFTGPPGIGKTTMTDMIHSCYKRVKNIDEDICLMYPWSEDKYQAPNSLVGIIHVNDAFQQKDEYATEGQMNLFQRFIDTFPLMASGAAVSEKNVHLNPDILLASTNCYSYTFSRSNGGATKFDRRYNMIDFVWTKHCKDEAKKEKIPPAEYYRRHGQRRGPPLVEYHGGYMENDDGNTCNFSIKREMDPPFRTTSPADVVGLILRMESERPEPMGKEGFFGDVEKCACGLPKGNVYCPCSKIPPPTFTIVTSREPEVIQEGLIDMDLPVASIIQAIFTFFSGYPGFFAGITVASTIFWAFRKFPMPRLTVETPGIPNKVVIEHTGMPDMAVLASTFERITSNIPYVLLGLATLKGVLIMLERFTLEGTIQSTPSYPPPPVTEKVRVNTSTNASWLGAQDNSFVMRITYIGSVQSSMYALLVAPQVIALPKHFFRRVEGRSLVYEIQEGETIRIVFRAVEHTIRFQRRFLITDDKLDASFYVVPNLSAAVGSIFNKLPATDESPGELCSLGNNQRLRVWPGMTYTANTTAGDCGLPLIGESSGAIYGYHVGKYAIKGDGISVPLSQGRIREALAEFKNRRVSVDVHSDVLPEAVLELMKEGRILPGLHPLSDARWYHQKVKTMESCDHFVIGHTLSFNQPKFSAHPTSLHGVFGGECKPYGKPHAGKAVLQPDNTYQSAATIRFDACDHTETFVPYDVGLRAVDSMLEDLRILPGDKVTPLSDYTALCGSPLNCLINGKDVTKSVGRTLQSLGLTKEQVFKDLGNGEYEAHPEFVSRAAEFRRHLYSEEPLEMGFVAAVPKDEVYPVEKAQKGRKRFFFLSDSFANHEMRKLLLPLIDYLLSKPFCSKIIATINCGSPQWNELYKFLTRFSEKVTDGDQSSMDTRHKELMMLYAEFMKRLSLKLGYTPEDARAVERLCIAASRYVLEMDGIFFICMCGLVSGRADTIICNSICLILLFYIAFFLLKPDGFEEEPSAVTSLATTGDDSAMNADPRIESWYNGEAIRREMRVMGYFMTAGDKSEVVGLKHISEISYLKRGFVKDGEFVWAPLAKDSIFKSLAYSIGRAGPEEQIVRDKSASHSAVREAFLHQRPFFEQLKARLQTIFPEEVYPTYEELLDDYVNMRFETWRVQTRNSIRYEPPSGEVVLEGRSVQLNRVEDTDGVVYPRGYGASFKCPTVRRGAVKDFPVLQNLPKNGGSNGILLTSSSEINPVSAEHETAPKSILALDPGHLQVASVPMVAPVFKAHPLETNSNFFAVPRLIYVATSDHVPFEISPFEDFFALPSVASRARAWAMYRGSIKIEIHYSGSSSVMGLTRVYGKPYSVGQPLTTYQSGEFDPINQPGEIATSLLPHADVDASCCCSHTLTLPFLSPWSMLPLGVSPWKLGIQVLNEVHSVTGLTPPILKMEIWASMPDVEFDILVPEGEVTGGTISNGLTYAASISRWVGQFLSTFSLLAEKGASAAASWGLSRPTERMTSVVLNRKWGRGTYMSGEPDFSSILGGDPAMGRDISGIRSPDYTHTVTEICRKWNMVKVQAAVNNDYYIHPNIWAAAMTLRQPTSMCHMGMMFEGWIGDMEVRLQVVGSPLIRGRIGVNVYPRGAVHLPTFVSDGSVIAHTFDVEGSTEFEFVVPYLHNSAFTPNDPSSIGSAVATSFFKYYWISEPRGPSATPVYPEVNIWVRVGNDFTFVIPSMAGTSDFIEYEGVLETLTCLGEKVDNLKELGTRQCAMYRIAPSVFTVPADGEPRGQSFTSPEILKKHAWTFDTWIRSTFWGYSGGTKWSIMAEGDFPGVAMMSAFQAAPYSTSAQQEFQKYSRGYVVHDFEDVRVCEVVVPDRSMVPYKLSKSGLNIDTTSETVECLFLNMENDTLWFQGAGEDRLYLHYLYPPLLEVLL